MAKQRLNKDTTAWIEVDVSGLKGKDKATYEAMREANRLAAQARQACEDMLIRRLRNAGALDPEHVPFIGFQFGKVTIAHEKHDDGSTGGMIVQKAAPKATGKATGKITI